jgi:hypothetical protein
MYIERVRAYGLYVSTFVSIAGASSAPARLFAVNLGGDDGIVAGATLKTQDAFNTASVAAGNTPDLQDYRAYVVSFADAAQASGDATGTAVYAAAVAMGIADAGVPGVGAVRSESDAYAAIFAAVPGL